MKKMWMILLVITVAAVFTGCQGKSQLKTGTYLLDGNAENYIYVVLDEKGGFQFSRGLALSYRPMGSYEVEGDRLILQAGPDETYTFLIDGEVLVYLEGFGEIIEKGSRFIYSEVSMQVHGNRAVSG
ncbi:hypothetical protein J3A84_12910 [Proteiniclasticum sp. SCR006]|uniref:Uncharacterized protein n=1 Tax=Proteiniclasticum aestuarii TaxID=2817862 RepID=A0A939KGV7_9CLOT|nr:hypothetical protein [Proteiniclasticum aestuarii]MBO1265932.1 hypothetical protein [Proteiniclasticum aestuarii]